MTQTTTNTAISQDMTGTSNEQPLDLDYQNTVEVVKRDCEDCGGEYAAFKALDFPPHYCPDCRGETEFFENTPSFFPSASDRPLMEFGPQSAGWCRD